MKKCTGGRPDVLGWFRAVLLLVVIAHAPSSSSGEVEGLFSAEVAVSGQDANERDEAIRRALGVVLVKVTGDRQVIAHPALERAFKSAGRYVAQYRYREVNLKQEGPETGTLAQLMLWVAFDADAVNRLLEQYGLPVWGTTRPSALVWVAVQDNRGRRLLDPAMDADLRQAMEIQAEERGIPLLFPLWDLEDQTRLTLADVWGNFADNVLNASQRYRPDAVLVGRINQGEPGQWYGRWTLYLGERMAAAWEVSAPDMQYALREGVDGHADALASRFAQVLSPSAQDRVLLAVEGINAYEDYARALSYLQSLNPVRSVQVYLADGQRVVFQLEIRGTREGLQQLISLGNVLSDVDRFEVRPVSDIALSAGGMTTLQQPFAEPDLRYRIRP